MSQFYCYVTVKLHNIILQVWKYNSSTVNFFGLKKRMECPCWASYFSNYAAVGYGPSYLIIS